jgi:membrane-bound lytic murein transglycosylase A
MTEGRGAGSVRWMRTLILGSLAATLVACATAPHGEWGWPWRGASAEMPVPAPTGQSPPADPPPPPGMAAPAIDRAVAVDDDPEHLARPVRERGPARWVPVPWSALPGWDQDQMLAWWPALLASCGRPSRVWADVCARAQLAAPADDAQVRDFVTTWLRPWRLEAQDGRVEGLATGYFEPVLAASRRPAPAFAVAMHAPPADLTTRVPHWSRQEIDTLPAAMASVRGREIAYLAHPLDLLLLQIQGSGRLRVTEPDGRVQTVRVAYAGHNGHPYRSVGRWLIEQGELRSHQASWPGIRAWADRRPERLRELMWANPRVIYFREEPLPDPGRGPVGAQGVPLTPGRSVAVDPRAVPYGTPLWIDTTEPLSTQPLQRLVMAQDTGSAIVGPVRVDYFWGWADDALEQAGRMRQPLRAWALWPRAADGP